MLSAEASCDRLVIAAACGPKRPPLLRCRHDTAMQKRVLAALTGETEITPGLKLANRFDIANKRAARDYLAASLKELGLTPQRQAYGTDSENIYAELKCGTPGADAIVLGAHYDTVRVAPGANDDGTGVVIVLGGARAMMASMRSKPKRHDMIFVFFDEEERGLIMRRAISPKC